MAESYSVEAFLKANTGDFEKGFKNASKQVDGLEKSTGSAGISIGKLVGTIAGVAAAIGIFSTLRDAVGKAFDRIDTMERFDRVMTEITGSTGEAQKVLDATNEIVKGTAYGLDTAAQSVQNFATRGIEVEKATKYMEAFGDAVAFYGDGSSEQLESVSDALAKMVTKGTVEMDQLNRLFDVGIDAVGIYAQATGQLPDEVQDALSAGAISAEEFIDVITEAMMEGTNGVLNISGAAKEAGTSWGGTFENMGAAVARGVESIITSIDEMLTSNGLPDMRQMVTNFGIAFETALTQAGELIVPFITKIIEVYNALKPWMPLIVAIVAGIAAFATTIAVINSVTSAIALVKTAFAALNAVILANPIALVIGLIVAAAALIYIYWEPISEFFSNLWSGIVEIFNLAYNWIVEAATTSFGNLVDVINSYLTAGKEIIMSIWDYIKDTFSNALEFIIGLVTLDFGRMKDAIQSQMQNAQNLLKKIWSAIDKFFSSVLGGIWNTVKKIFSNIFSTISSTVSNIRNTITSVFNAIRSTISSVMNAIRSVISSVWNAIRSVISSILNGIRSTVSSIWNGIRSTISSVVNSIRSTVSNIFNSLKGIVSSAFNGVKSAVSSGMKGALNVVTNMAKSFFNAGKNIVTSIANGIKGAIGSVTGAIGNVASKIRNFLPFSPAKEGPLRDIMNIQIGESIAKSIDKGKKPVQRAMNNLAGTARDSFDVDVAGQINSVNAHSNRKMSYDYQNELTINKQPANINLILGGREFDAFVDDISTVQDRKTRVLKSFQ